MDTMFKVRHYVNKFLITVLGPADQPDDRDPIQQLNREYAQRFGSKTVPAQASPSKALASQA
jgi:hypothetical protein